MKFDVKQAIVDRLHATKRKNVEIVIEYMSNNGFFTRQCHTHHRYNGGLADHAWQAYQIALRLDAERCASNPQAQKLDEDSIAICALLHDFCDCSGLRDITGHGRRSAGMLKELGFKLTQEEFLAIRFHMSLKDKESHPLYENAKRSQLRYIVHKADGVSAHLHNGCEDPDAQQEQDDDFTSEFVSAMETLGITYKEFSKDPSKTIECYKEFYFGSFINLLLEYYPYRTNPDEKNPYCFIKAATRGGQQCITLSRGLCPSYRSLNVPSEQQYFFSASMFFMSLIPQVIYKIAGDTARLAFHRSSGWPILSCGLGGIMSPEQWLYESEIIPQHKEVEYYNTLLDIILPFHCNELRLFLRGIELSIDNKAYTSLCKSIDGKVDEIIEEIKRVTEQAKENFVLNKWPLYYIQW